MSGDSLLRTLSIKEIGFEKNATAFLDEGLNSPDEVNGFAKGNEDLLFIIILAPNNGDRRFNYPKFSLPVISLI